MELNREQIIKALECCITGHHENCCNLGKWHEEWNCMTDIMKQSLDVINELTEQLANPRKHYRTIVNQIFKETISIGDAMGRYTYMRTYLEEAYRQNLALKHFESEDEE